MVGGHLWKSEGDDGEDCRKCNGNSNDCCDEIHYLSLDFNQDRVIGSHLYLL